MGAILKVPKGQDPYDVIGQYIQNHITAIEDIIATIELDGMTTNELFMADMHEDVYFYWKYDWWEGEEDVALLDFFPVSGAEPERKTGYWIDDGIDGCGAAMIEYRNLKCDKCGWSSSLIIPRNFCPNCGEKKDSKKIVSLFTIQKGDSNV